MWNQYFSHVLGKSFGLTEITNPILIRNLILYFSLLPLLLHSCTCNLLRSFINQWKLHRMVDVFLLLCLWWKLQFQRYVLVSHKVIYHNHFILTFISFPFLKVFVQDPHWSWTSYVFFDLFTSLPLFLYLRILHLRLLHYFWIIPQLNCLLDYPWLIPLERVRWVLHFLLVCLSYY